MADLHPVDQLLQRRKCRMYRASFGGIQSVQSAIDQPRAVSCEIIEYADALGGDRDLRRACITGVRGSLDT